MSNTILAVLLALSTGTSTTTDDNAALKAVMSPDLSPALVEALDSIEALPTPDIAENGEDITNRHYFIF
ncbi:hypothetical protein HON52_01880 [Candidatus Uhrbacteria bacterium]|nr:hypothetical protein [Candidatus Uhrbacteria bacterium]